MNSKIITGKSGIKVLLTGKPGTGKTTVIIQLADKLKDRAAGFYTAEIRKGRRRVGFELVSLVSGKRLPLAHVNFDSSKRVGKYGVKTENLEPFLDELTRAVRDENPHCLLIDEIGKMELYSPYFKNVIREAFNSSHPVAATIMARPEPFCDSLKNRPAVEIWEIDQDNRDRVPHDLAEIILSG